MATVPKWQAGVTVSPQQVAAPLAVNGFVYRATQLTAATTGAAEPNWPLVAGGTVVDGGVTWTAITATAITWEAVALYKSGASEPAWPTTPGATIADGTITWTARVPNVSDSKCPNTKQVRILASKVYAVYEDVTRFSATNNPNDWSTEDDAGFLPHGLHATGEVDGQALAEYRGNLVVMTPSDFVVFQVDPDPAQMAHLDTITGIGTLYPRAAASVASDLFFLTSQGVRSVGIAAASENLQDGDVGTPIDPLVRAELATGVEPFAFYNVSMGEWWLVFGSKVFVLQQSRSAKIEAWSRDELPFVVDDYTHLGGALYLRAGDDVFKLDASLQSDNGVAFTSMVWWPYLDLGAGGVTKQLVGVDLVAAGDVSIQIGYDQDNPAAYTPTLTIPADTLPGGMVPIPAAGPSLSVKLSFTGAWHLDSLSLFINNMRATA